MSSKKDLELTQPIWAYGYQIVPPQPANRLGNIKTLLRQENAEAQRQGRTWAGKLLLEALITHILVVSDSPEQNGGINHRLEAELKRLKAEFLMTAPLAVLEKDKPKPKPNTVIQK